MTQLTAREILDAIRRGLEETARRFTEGRAEDVDQHPPPREPTDEVKGQGSQIQRKA